MSHSGNSPPAAKNRSLEVVGSVNTPGAACVRSIPGQCTLEFAIRFFFLSCMEVESSLQRRKGKGQANQEEYYRGFTNNK